MITVTILTKNSQKYLREVLQALTPFPEVLILDSGSQDQTLNIAKSFSNVVIHHSPTFEGFGVMHNKASSFATNDWIFSVDSDEIVTPLLSEEILNLSLDPQVVYAVSRHNFYKGKFIKGCGWYPDRQYRLYHRKYTRYSNAYVHEAVIIKNRQVKTLKSPLKHYSYEKIADFLTKMQTYSDLFVKENKKKKSSLSKAILHSLFAFFKSYILQRGILDGKEGFIISSYQAHTALYKYLKLWESQR